MQEKEIIALIRDRDERGAAALLEHYGPLMRYIAAPVLPDPQDREDCVSEAAMRVWERIESFDPERGAWCAWLTALTRNAALNRARQNRGRAALEEIPPDLPAPDPTPEEALLQKERQNALHRALQALSVRERTLFFRKYYYLQSTSQIAAELGTTERAVEGRLYRIKRHLRKELGGESDE